MDHGSELVSLKTLPQRNHCQLRDRLPANLIRVRGLHASHHSQRMQLPRADPLKVQLVALAPPRFELCRYVDSLTKT